MRRTCLERLMGVFLGRGSFLGSLGANFTPLNILIYLELTSFMRQN